MSTKAFHASKLKVQRANRHISDLNREVVSFFRGKPYRVVVEQGTEPTQHAWTIRVRKEIPDIFAGYIGDAIHNLRASLDLLACDLVTLNGGNTNNVSFPFADGETSLEAMIEKGHIHRAAENVVDVIRSLQPYKGGNDALRAIHDLDIMDKHRSIIPIAQFASFGDVKIMRDNVLMTHLQNCHFGPVKDGVIGLSMPAARNVKVGQEIKTTFKIAFGEGVSSIQGERIIETLKGFSKIVDDIIKNFETLCFTSES